MGASEWINKAKDFATGHKDQVQGALDKAEDVVKAKTGDKYADKIAKGRGALEDKLGYNETGASPDTTAGGPGSAEGASIGPAGQPGGPATGDGLTGETGEGGEPRAGQ